MTDNAYHHGDLRSCLIKAGIELINQVGEQQFSLRKVCALCSVSQAAPYSHFKNKEDLLTAMQDHVIQQFMDVLQNAILSCPDQNDPNVIIQMGRSYVLFFIENPQYFEFLFSHSNMDVNLSIDEGGYSNFPPLELLKAVAVPILGKQLSKEKMEDTIISLWATVHGLASIATMKNIHYEKRWEDKITDIIWNR